jgi:hypothetical protein
VIDLPRVCLVTDRRRLSPDARTRDDEISALERLLDDAIDAATHLARLGHSSGWDILAGFVGGLLGRAAFER